MSAYHLRKTEVVYELKIRNLSTDGTAGDLRKRLSQGLASNTKIDEAVVNALMPEPELEECEGKLQDLSALVADYEGNFNDNEYHRLMARLWHLYNRVSRIPVGAAVPDVEESKDVLSEKSKELLDAFEDAKTKHKTSNQQENTDDDTHLRTRSTVQPTGQTQGLPSPPEPTVESADRERRLWEGSEYRGDWRTGVGRYPEDRIPGKDGLPKGGISLQEDEKAQEHRRRDEERQLKEERMKQEEKWRQEEMRLQKEKQLQEVMWKQRERKLQQDVKGRRDENRTIVKNTSEAYQQGNGESYREDRRSSFQPRYVPVYKWGLMFDGQSQSIGAFLQRVEEIRRARGVTPEELFDSAVDLFSGPALVWYRSTMGRINTWGSLCLEMKIVFQSPDHDIRLQQEIFSRVQGEAEPIDLFIAAMEGLYGRLATVVSEDVRLRQIFHNLSPQLQDRLALFDVTSVEQLRQLGRKAEAGRFRSSVPRGSTRNVGALEPDLAYEPSRRRTNQLASVETPPKKEIRAACWNCGEVGHRHNMCQKTKKRFCFGCGTPDVIKSNCPKCTKCTKCANCSKNS